MRRLGTALPVCDLRVDSGDTIGQLIGVTAIWRIWPLGAYVRARAAIY